LSWDAQQQKEASHKTKHISCKFETVQKCKYFTGRACKTTAQIEKSGEHQKIQVERQQQFLRPGTHW